MTSPGQRLREDRKRKYGKAAQWRKMAPLGESTVG
jgi:hypothetical protein